jgi:hypothetical protein
VIVVLGVPGLIHVRGHSGFQSLYTEVHVIQCLAIRSRTTMELNDTFYHQTYVVSTHHTMGAFARTFLRGFSKSVISGEGNYLNAEVGWGIIFIGQRKVEETNGAGFPFNGL